MLVSSYEICNEKFELRTRVAAPRSAQYFLTSLGSTDALGNHILVRAVTSHLPYQQQQSSSTLPIVPSSSSGFLNQSLLAGDTAVVPSASAYRCRGHSATMSLGEKRPHLEQKRRSWRQNPASRRE
jgi:hypothetical protein